MSWRAEDLLLKPAIVGTIVLNWRHRNRARKSERPVHQAADMAKCCPKRAGRSLGRNANAARMPTTGAKFIPTEMKL
jgi:hypothetical protein